MDMQQDRKKAQPLKGGHPWYRRARFLIGLAVLLGIAVASRLHMVFSPCVFFRLGELTLVCPLGTLEVNLAGHGIIRNLMPGFLVVCLLLFILGRMWCGWVCPASLAGKALDSVWSFLLPGMSEAIRKRWRGLNGKLHRRVNLGRIHMVGLVVGMLLGALIFRYPFWSILCPLGVISRAIIEGAVHFSLRWEILLLILPVLTTLFFRFGWKCACPVGLLHGLGANANRMLLPVADSSASKPCNECGHCRAVCPAGLYPAKEISTFNCTKYLRCVEHCPRGCLRLNLIRVRPVNRTKKA